MVRSVHGWRRAAPWATVMAVVASTPSSYAHAAGSDPPELAACDGRAFVGTSAIPRLSMVLDDRGWLVGHRFEVAGSAPLPLGRGAFLDGPFDERYVVGDSVAGRSHLRVVDAARACVEAEVTVDGLVFAATIDRAGRDLYHDLVAPRTRADMGVWRTPFQASGPAERILDGVPAKASLGRVWSKSFAWGPGPELAAQACGEEVCITRIVDPASGAVRTLASADQGVLIALTERGLVVNDGRCHAGRCPSVTFSRSGARVDGPDTSLDDVPVPEWQSDIWREAVLGYSWSADDPPDWMRAAIRAAAADVEASRRSNAPRFSYASDSDDSIGLRSEMTGNCERAIACATADIGEWWVIRLRPHRTVLPWGTIYWCEAYAEPQGNCVDTERTVIHEMGHVEGLWHADGLGLSWFDTVMHPGIPFRGDPGWALHRFGPCDQITLQQRYDVPTSYSTVALCGRRDTSLSFEASDRSIAYQAPVTFTATLRIRDRAEYGRLGGNRLSGRGVTIQRRPPGGSWTAFTPTEGSDAGTYVLTFRPTTTFEYRAVFDRPGGEGVRGAVSESITVSVGPCTGPHCPETSGPIERSH